jgi:hypothetical protein
MQTASLQSGYGSGPVIREIAVAFDCRYPDNQVTALKFTTGSHKSAGCLLIKGTIYTRWFLK